MDGKCFVGGTFQLFVTTIYKGLSISSNQLYCKIFCPFIFLLLIGRDLWRILSDTQRNHSGTTHVTKAPHEPKRRWNLGHGGAPTILKVENGGGGGGSFRPGKS